MRLSILLIAAVIGLARETAAQELPPPEMRRVVDEIIGAAMAGRPVPGMIVGVSRRGHRYFFGYGRSDSAGHPFGPDTPVAIASCTKVFTTTLFALLVERRRMGLDDSIQSHMPDGIGLQPKARRATLAQLADFTSGMPRDPPARTDVAGFLRWVARWSPAGAPP